MTSQIVYNEKENKTYHYHLTAVAHETKGWEMKEFTVIKDGMVVSEGIFCTKCFRTQAYHYEQTKTEKPISEIRNRSKLRRMKKKEKHV